MLSKSFSANAPRNLGCWAVMSRMVLQIEQTVANHGYRTQTQGAVMYKLARGGAQAVAWIAEHGNSESVPRRSLIFGPDLFAAAEQALWTAIAYESFTTVFPLWHKLVLKAELIRPDLVRFGGEDEHSRRVRAYLQGLRPLADRERPHDAGNRPGTGGEIANSEHCSKRQRRSVLILLGQTNRPLPSDLRELL